MRANNEQLAVVQDKVSRGEYEVNSQRVAVAILERIGVLQSPDVSSRESWSWPATGNERPPGSLSRTASAGDDPADFVQLGAGGLDCVLCTPASAPRGITQSSS